jgi:hypothetical protein
MRTIVDIAATVFLPAMMRLRRFATLLRSLPYWSGAGQGFAAAEPDKECQMGVVELILLGVVLYLLRDS